MILHHIGGEATTVHTADGRALDAIWCEASPPSKHGAAILFHPNSAICLDMAAWGLWYVPRSLAALCLIFYCLLVLKVPRSPNVSADDHNGRLCR